MCACIEVQVNGSPGCCQGLTGYFFHECLGLISVYDCLSFLLVIFSYLLMSSRLLEADLVVSVMNTWC